LNFPSEEHESTKVKGETEQISLSPMKCAKFRTASSSALLPPSDVVLGAFSSQDDEQRLQLAKYYQLARYSFQKYYIFWMRKT